ncbi:hypothetical protein CRG98_045648, partial [Punica granatum]
VRSGTPGDAPRRRTRVYLTWRTMFSKTWKPSRNAPHHPNQRCSEKDKCQEVIISRHVQSNPHPNAKQAVSHSALYKFQISNSCLGSIPTFKFQFRAPGVRSTDKQTAPQNGLTGTQGLPGPGNKLQTTFRNSARSPETESLGLPGPTVPDRGRRANDHPRGKRIARTNAQRSIKGQGMPNSTPNVRTGQNRLPRRRVARMFVHTTHGDIRLIQILVIQAFQIHKLIGHRRSDARSIKSQAFSGFSLNRMRPTASQAKPTSRGSTPQASAGRN